MTDLETDNEKLDRNIARAKAFAEMFPNLKVNYCGVKTTDAMAAYNNPDTGMGFMATWTEGKNDTIFGAWVEYKGRLDATEMVACEFLKIFGPPK